MNLTSIEASFNRKWVLKLFNNYWFKLQRKSSTLYCQQPRSPYVKLGYFLQLILKDHPHQVLDRFQEFQVYNIDFEADGDGVRNLSLGNPGCFAGFYAHDFALGDAYTTVGADDDMVLCVLERNTIATSFKVQSSL